MENHPIITLVQKIETKYPKEIILFWKASSKKRTIKFYQLISTAKNNDQLQKELLYKKLFSKSYTEKNDYLWRNEIRVLKEEIEQFLIEIEHQHISKNNETYNDWLLVQAFNRLKYSEGIDEKTELLLKQKDDFASYQFVLDACLIRLDNLRFKITDLDKRRKYYPEYIQESKAVLNDLIACYCAQLNLQMTHSNWLSYNHQMEYREALIGQNYDCTLPKNAISNFYNHLSASFTDDDSKNYQTQIENLDAALENIEPIYKNNKLLQENRVVVLMSKGRELSANGFFREADEILKSIKKDIDVLHQQQKTIFYVNYITNLVKCKMYKEALYIMEYEFSTDNLLYKNMILQNRLLCYLYLRDTENLAHYITYDLDAAPFPQNYVLKIIKSVYFYLIHEYETAISIITSLVNAKISMDKMSYHKSISILYKKLFTAAQKNILNKKMPSKEIKLLQDAIEEFEKTTPPEFKLVSIYLWLKQEIEYNLDR